MKKIKRQLKLAKENARKEISDNASIGGRYSGALASEGYAGGYLAALQDVLLALDGIRNNNSRYWPKIGD